MTFDPHDISHYISGVPDTPRAFTNFLVEYYGGVPITGVEIGVLEGANAASMIHLLNIIRLYLVDPYLPYAKRTTEDMAMYEANSHRILSNYSGVPVWIRGTSEYVAAVFTGEVDFVYIDGPHTYANTYRDIELWYPRVRPGGIIGGDNYQPIPGGWEIMAASTNYANDHGLYIGNYEFFSRWKNPAFNCKSWWIIKPWSLA